MLDGKRFDINSMEESLHNLSLSIDRLDVTSSQNRADFVTLFKDLTSEVLASLTSMREKFELFESVKPKLDQVLSHILHSKEAARDESGVKIEQNQARYIPKLKLPEFDGEKNDARVWISKCKTFFDFCPMSEQQMVGYASFHMIGHAFKWFMSYVDDNGDFLKWNDFAAALINRFSDIKYVDSSGLVREFAELTQSGTVLEYLEKYEDIVIAMNDKFPDIPRSYYVSIFIGGLQEEIKMKVKMFQPDTILEAFRLARICEASLKEKEKRRIKVVDEAVSTAPAIGAVAPNTTPEEQKARDKEDFAQEESNTKKKVELQSNQVEKVVEAQEESNTKKEVEPQSNQAKKVVDESQSNQAEKVVDEPQFNQAEKVVAESQSNQAEKVVEEPQSNHAQVVAEEEEESSEEEFSEEEEEESSEEDTQSNQEEEANFKVDTEESKVVVVDSKIEAEGNKVNTPEIQVEKSSAIPKKNFFYQIKTGSYNERNHNENNQDSSRGGKRKNVRFDL